MEESLCGLRSSSSFSTPRFFLMYAILGFVLHMDAVVAEFTEMGAWLLFLFAVLMNFSLLLYDRLLVPLTAIYINKLRPRLRFLIR